MSKLSKRLCALALVIAGVTAHAQTQTWIGEAPFCSATPAQCTQRGMKFVRTHPSGNGDACLIGTKVLCESEPGAAIKAAVCPRNAKAIKQPLRCSCPDNVKTYRAIWGSGPYTNDSSVCGAARHAGVIGAQGGSVLVQPAAGQSSYRGSRANGITTRNYGKWPGSFQVSR